MSVLRLRTERPLAAHIVAIVSPDAAYRRALAEAFAVAGRKTVCGDDASCLSNLEDWDAGRRFLDVEAVVIDLDEDITSALDALDAVRRRDCRAFVIVLSRIFGALGNLRVGANLILEGDVAPEVVVDALRNKLSGPTR